MAKQSKTSQNRALCSFAHLVMLLSALFLCSCSEFLSGKPKKNDYIELKNDPSIGCLDSVSSDIRGFFNQQKTGEALDASVDCINKTLGEFQTKVEGRAEASSFTPDEIYDILGLFAKDLKISREAARNLILLKAALLGGDKSKITKTEIDLLKSYLLIVKEEAKKVQPYIKLLYFEKGDKVYSKEFIKQGFGQVNASMKVLLKASQIPHSSYSVEDFKNLIFNLMQLSEDNKNMLAIATKVNYLFNGNLTFLSDDDRLRYIDNITDVLSLYTNLLQGYVPLKTSTSGEINGTFEFAGELLRIIENCLQFRKNHIISSGTIDDLITELLKGDVLPWKLTRDDALTFYKTVFVRLFEKGLLGDVWAFTGIRDVHLTAMKRELAVYRLYSRLLDKTLSPTESQVLPEVQRRFGLLRATDEQDILAPFSAAEQAKIVNIVEELRYEFLAPNPTIYKDQKVVVSTNQHLAMQTWKDLERGLYIKMLARLLMLGWGFSGQFKSLHDVFVTEAGMIQWYAEFKAFGIQIKLLDPRNENSGSTNLKSGDLFTRSGNGNGKLSFKEAVENLGSLITGGGEVTDQMRADMIKANCEMPALDVFGNHFMYESCLYDTLLKNYQSYFSTLPYLVSYLDSQTPAERKDFFTTVLDVGRTDKSNAGKRVETSDIGTVGTLMFYIEALYAVHDTNGSTLISEAEIRSAYPKFELVATEIAHKNSSASIKKFTSWVGWVAGYGCFGEEDLIRESFIFMIYNGRTPAIGDLSFEPCVFGKPLMKFSGEVDRKKAINAFKALQ